MLFLKYNLLRNHDKLMQPKRLLQIKMVHRNTQSTSFIKFLSIKHIADLEIYVGYINSINIVMMKSIILINLFHKFFLLKSDF